MILYTLRVFKFVTLISPHIVVHLKPVSHYPTTSLSHCPTVPPCYSYICKMATVSRTARGIKDEKLVLWVLVEQLKDTDRTEGMGIT
jgi:hypothetical protein